MIGEPLQILLVENNQAHAEIVMRTLADHRIANRVYNVADGEAALDYLMRRRAYRDPRTSPRPHLILLDLRLPKIDGIEVLRFVKESDDLRRIPVIVLTTSAREQDAASAYDSYANGYLVKPVDFTKFSEMMADLGFFWLGWNHYPWE